MNARLTHILFACAFACATSAVPAQTRDTSIPHLRRQGTATQLIVDGKPFLVLGGELGNSSASSMEYMESRWSVLKDLHLNTVIAPAYWELIEPREGSFDFSSVDSLLAAARRNQLRIALLWFGSWKNSMSSYVPGWVKANQARFPRTEATKGQGQEILAPYDSANWQADARAFRALMRHLKQVDGTRHTVIMVQVENEIGMLPQARDHSDRADALFNGPVPAELTSYLSAHESSLTPELSEKWKANGSKTAGSWPEVFGADVHTDELFMAWWFARYAEHVAAAGKAEYPLPMNVNAALIRPGYLPGRYVSAGPLPHLMDVWHAAAPSIDILSPDIYFLNFKEWVDRYARSDNPLFIPEASLGARSATNALYVFGAKNGIGFSPFSIENTPNPKESPLGKSFGVLEQLAPLILEHQGRGTMTGVIPIIQFDGSTNASPQTVKLPGLKYSLNVAFSVPSTQVTPPDPERPVQVIFGDAGRDYRGPIAGALIIALDTNEVLIAGAGVTVRAVPEGSGPPIAGIESVREGRYVDGKWVRGLWLNGDQTDQGRSVRIGGTDFQILRVRFYRYR